MNPRRSAACRPSRPQFRLLFGASVSALFLAGTAAHADGNNPFARIANPAAQAAQAAAVSATQNNSANAASQRALAAFAQAAAIRRNMDAGQLAARAAAAAAQVKVPNGLGVGGLQVAPGVGGDPSLWLNAKAPTQTTASNGRTEVTVEQTGQQAILNWQTFNVGRETDLSFDQHGNSTWVVLNRVNDPSLNPTQILGTIKAPGTVLIMNRNGVIFGGASQVNTGSLLAGAAAISDSQFLNSGIYSSLAKKNYAASFTDALGAVQVQAGAQISTNAPSSVVQGGGYVMLLGGSVDNAGSITTPLGQTLLAAGDSFLLRPGLGTNANQFSTTRGSEVAPVLAVGSVNGSVSNEGSIYAQQGDITLAGHTVTQSGVLLSTTSVNQRGTIHLLDSAADTTGSITLGSNSYTAVLPELDSGDTALNSQRSALIADSTTQNTNRATAAVAAFDDLGLLADREDQSRIEINTGGNIEFQGGSLTQAQGGQIAASAGKRIQVDSKATLDVSGVQNVALDVASNEIKVNIQGNELRDSPANRDSGALFNSNVWVDARDLVLVPAGTGGYATDRYYTAGGLIEVSGYLGKTGHTIGEWSASGGTINLSAKEVVAQQDSLFNVSGGSLAYQGGDVTETLLQGADGKMYTADNAPANVQMVSVGKSFVVKHDRWGEQYDEVYSSPFTQTTVTRHEDGYIVGKDGGQLILSTPTALFQGTIAADVITGANQTGARPASVSDPYALTQGTAPLAGGLVLGKYNAGGPIGAYASDVRIGSGMPDLTAGLTPGAALPAGSANTAWFDAATLSSFGLGSISLTTSSSIVVNAPLTLAQGGSLNLVGQSIDVNADITARGGSINLGNIQRSSSPGGTGYVFTDPVSGGAHATIGAGVTLDLRGLWVNALLNPASAPDLAFVNGGSLTIDTTQDVTIGKNAVIDVSSGGGVLANGKSVGGTGGNISLIAGDAFGGNSKGGTLTLDGSFKAAGVNGGGTLNLSAPGTLVIGTDSTLSGGTLTLPAGTAAHVNLTLAASLTIPAGSVLPLSLSGTSTMIPLDTPLTQAINGADLRTATSGQYGITTAAAWVVPPGVSVGDYSTGFNIYNPGTTIPAGTNISSIGGAFQPGTVIPSTVFPHGLLVQQYAFTTPAGSIAKAATTYAAGTIIPAGTVFQQTVAIQPVTSLDPALFQTGFSQYQVNAGSGLLVASGTQLAPAMPVYRVTGDSTGYATGSDPAAALSLWLPPTFLANPVNGTLTQRGGASLTLSSLASTGTTLSGGAIVVAPGSSINVDPGQSIKLDAFGQLTVDGSLTARGGSISLINEATGSDDPSRNFNTAGDPRGTSIWVGSDARLDVSGLASSAVDQYGRAYGLLSNGGSIQIGGSRYYSALTHLNSSTTAFVVIRPGAEIDADGAALSIDPNAGSAVAGSGGTLNLASNGGSIALDSYSGIYNEGNLHARSGGAGAGGGSLSVLLDTPVFPNSGGGVQATDLVTGILTVVQAQPPSALPADIAPGTDAASLGFGRATVSADAVRAGGFDSLSLYSRDYLMFSGDVSLQLGQSLTLTSSAIISSVPLTQRPAPGSTPVSGTVKLSAPYVLITSPTTLNTDNAASAAIGTPSYSVTLPSVATFEVDADQLDVQGSVIFSALQFLPNGGGLYAPGYKTVSLVSQGDIRFLAPTPYMGSFTSLVTGGDLAFRAAQLYPATNAVAYISAGNANAGTGDISISRINGLDPTLPLSVFGTLIFNAATIEQGGIVRAPLGSITLGGNGGGYHSYSGQATQQVELLPDSITSVSAAGLVLPYGGTSDGVNYNYNGSALSPMPVAQFTANQQNQITLGGSSVAVDKGAVLDLSGGGTLAGAAFISGRGGSVNVLGTPLINADPYNTYSSAGDKVYAIVPGYGSSYAPVNAENGAGDPAVGQQITIPAGVPGLPPGTYTLLPSNYALLPGAFRVELGKASPLLGGGVSALGNGSYALSGTSGIANTGVHSAQPLRLLLTPAAAVRDLSQYDEESYSDFMLASAARFSGLRPELPGDAGTLTFSLLQPSQPAAGSTGPAALSFNGVALLQGAAGGGYGGTVTVTAGYNGALEVDDGTATAGFKGVSISADTLNAIAAPRLILGGTLSQGLQPGLLVIQGSGSVYVRPDVTLQAGEIFLAAGNVIDVGAGAVLSTIGQSAAPYDSSSGYNYQAGSTVLALSNGNLNFVGNSTGTGSITIEAGASLYAGGTLAFSTNGPSSIDNTAHFGAKNIALAVNTVNIGSSADVAAAGAPTGLLFNQALFDFLIKGDPTHGAPAMQQLTLSAAGSINLYGSAGLDASGSGVDLVLNTPAIFGSGAAGDQATIAAGKITWNGIYGATAPAIVAGGPGNGLGTLNFKADEIDLGQYASLDTTSSNRYTYGFGNVNLIATKQIVSAGNSSLAVYQAPGSGGNLTLSAPLLTGVQKSVMAYSAGGSITVNTPDGSAPSQAVSSVAGAEIDLSGDSVDIDSAIRLPSGKLVVNAVHDIQLGGNSRIDLSGQPATIEAATVYGFGGNASFNSVQGGFSQASGSVIDVSATQANAGSVSIAAGQGTVTLGGSLKGAVSGGDSGNNYTSGDFSATAASFADFAGLNALLTQGGFFDARSFDLKQGSLSIGDGVKAHQVAVSVDNGSLTVNGLIDASGAGPGSIRLAAQQGLTLASGAVLDAHGNALLVDSYKQPIDSKNTGTVELAATHGQLTLAPGATIDLSSPDGVARGQINLDAARTGETSGDIDIDASGPLNIKGAGSIAVNAFWTYSPTDPYGTIVQDNGDSGGAPVSASTGYVGMNQIDARSQAFIDAALLNAGLQSRLGGLKAYSGAFHLRPGVEIDSATPNGTLTVAGDINLAGFRYASLNPNYQKTGVYGSGEPGALVIRAGGNLDVVGSISDGFAPVPASADDNGWLVQSGMQSGSVETLLPVALLSGTTFPNTAGLSLRYDIPIGAATISANAVVPVQVTLASSYTIPAGTKLAAAVYDGNGKLLYAAGSFMASATVLPSGTQLAAGSVLPGTIGIAPMTWPAGASLGVFYNSVTLSAGITVPFEGIIPGGANLQLAGATAPTRPTLASGTQGSALAIAPMLPQGELSWSIRGVAGADLGAADTRIVKPLSALRASGVSGNITLIDAHNSMMAASNVTVKKYFYYYNGGSTRYYTSGSNAFGCTHYGNTACGVAYVAQSNPAKILAPMPSVLRTGTGDLDLIAGGSFSEQSLYGVYTAGTQSAPVLAADGSNPYNLPRGLTQGSVVPDPLEAAVVLATYSAWYPEHGGNVLISAQQDVRGDIAIYDNTLRYIDSDLTSNWLWRQGGGGIATDPTAWWVNFGTYIHTQAYSPDTSFAGFQGIGTLGGGNLTVIAGGNAGVSSSRSSTGLDLAVVSTGRVLPDGTLLQTGGGDLVLKVGGALNAVDPYSVTTQSGDFFGSISDLRGNISISAGSMGSFTQNLGSSGYTSLDPRTPAYGVYKNAIMAPGPTVTPGDGSVSIDTRGDVVLGGAADAGMASPLSLGGIPYNLINPDGSHTFMPGGAGSAFSLWTPTTAISLYSAGGDASVRPGPGTSNNPENAMNGFYPGTLSVVAANGDIRFAPAATTLELAPSPDGQLTLLAAGSIYGSGNTVAMSGADMSTLATPFNPVFNTNFQGGGKTNASPGSPNFGGSYKVGGDNPIAFGSDTPTSALHAGDSQPALVYAGVDIDDLTLGQTVQQQPGSGFNPAVTTWYIAAKPFNVMAGRDIVGTGTTPDVFLNVNPDDISLVQAGRDIIYQSVTVAGPGLLQVQAGRNLYQGFYGRLESVGPLFDVDPTSPSSGAGIVAMAGVGPNGPDYTDFAKLYFNAANQLPGDGTPLAGSGKVVHAYDQELYAWLQQRFGYKGTAAGALQYFLALPADQQGVFVRQVYYTELTAGGREYNDPDSSRFGSYLRGRDAIATLFPTKDAQGNAISYSGGITMFSGYITPQFGNKYIADAGIRTDFGGDIQVLNPAGQTVIGVEGVAPGAGAGLLTQGTGDIDIYSAGSILLGQSRILTTFGGNILAWSATGDINAGRGSKTSVLFTPPRRVYNSYGGVTLSPQVPSSGAGIATLAPIPQVPAGNIDLIAPLGTVDAGEAGIRVSGNINVAALHVVNVANIEVKGSASGLPVVVAVNTGALTAASSAASAVSSEAERLAERSRPKAMSRDIPSIITGRILGFGDE